MPATFRAFLQGIGAALPKVVELMDEEEMRKLQERQVAVQEEGLALRKQEYSEVVKPQAEASIESMKLHDQLAKDNADLDRQIKSLDIKMKELQDRWGEKNAQQVYDLNEATIDKLLAEKAEAYARKDFLNAQATQLGVENRTNQWALMTKVVNMTRGLKNDPEGMKFLTTEFNSPKEMFAAFAANRDKFSDRFWLNASGVVETLMALEVNYAEQEVKFMQTEPNKGKLKRGLMAMDAQKIITLKKMIDLASGGPYMDALVGTEDEPEGEREKRVISNPPGSRWMDLFKSTAQPVQTYTPEQLKRREDLVNSVYGGVKAAGAAIGDSSTKIIDEEKYRSMYDVPRTTVR